MNEEERLADLVRLAEQLQPYWRTAESLYRFLLPKPSRRCPFCRYLTVDLREQPKRCIRCNRPRPKR